MKLEEWRKEIDLVDAEIIKLLNQRARIARKIGVLKVKAGLPVVDPEREAEILRNACSENQNLIDDAGIISIYRRIIRESKRLQIRATAEIDQTGMRIY